MDGRFVGVGVTEYAGAPPDRQLEHAVSDVADLAALIADPAHTLVLRNPSEEEVRAELKAVIRSMSGGSLVLAWSGYGVGSVADGLRLLANNSDAHALGGLGITEVAGAGALSGASQVLFVIDTCFSGAAVAATEVAHRLMLAAPPEGGHVWVGVLTSCLDVETARDGLFGQVVREVIRYGPDDPDLRVTRWSKHSRFVRGDDVCDAVLKNWRSEAQRPEFAAHGSAWWMFPNPLYDEGAPEQVVEHLLRAARGHDRSDERSYFTGRTAEVDQVVAWVDDGSPGVFVVTGPAGTGKSAIVGRVASLSNPRERARLLSEGQAWAHADPGERSVDAHVHARALTADRAAEVLAGQLVARGLLATLAPDGPDVDLDDPAVRERGRDEIARMPVKHVTESGSRGLHAAIMPLSCRSSRGLAVGVAEVDKQSQPAVGILSKRAARASASRRSVGRTVRLAAT